VAFSIHAIDLFISRGKKPINNRRQARPSLDFRIAWLALTFDEIIEVALGPLLIQSRVKWATGGRRKIRRRHPLSGCRSRTRFPMDMGKV